MVISLRDNEVIANELDMENFQVLELAVNEETLKSRFLRVLPDEEAMAILQMFVDHDTDQEFIDKCKKIIDYITKYGSLDI